MPSPSFAAHFTRTSTRLAVTATSALATVALVFAFAASPQASAQAHKVACTTRAKHDRSSHTCSASKGHRGHVKGKAKAGAHRAKRHTATGSGRPPSPPGGEEAAEATCSDGTSATSGGEGSFTCADGSEPGCEEGLAPVVSNSGSSLLCEPEADSEEGGGEEEG